MQMAPGIADKKNNALPMHGNEKTMNLNNLILTNILSSHYFKVNLYQLKTYHEVIDEIYYNVNHLEPWEKGSRKTSGQTGMCGGVRGVGAGGIVSTAFCILYKLFTLKLTRKQLVGLLNHSDSPYIRALGFMYIRYTQPPRDLWDWYEPYMEDTEEVDPKAGGGQTMTMGDLVRHLLTKLDWFSTLFPRIPVPIQKEIERKITEYKAQHPVEIPEEPAPEPTPKDEGEYKRNEDHHHHRGREEEWTNNQRHNDRSTEDHRHGGDVRKTEDKRPDDHRSKRSNNEDHRRSEDHRRGGDKKSNDHREKRNDDRKNDDYRERRNDDHRRSPERRKRSSPDRRDYHHSKREKLDIAEELARERDRQKKASHHRHRSPHRHHHRSSKHH